MLIIKQFAKRRRKFHIWKDFPTDDGLHDEDTVPSQNPDTQTHPSSLHLVLRPISVYGESNLRPPVRETSLLGQGASHQLEQAVIASH